jgi:hypothetical protein
VAGPIGVHAAVNLLSRCPGVLEAGSTVIVGLTKGGNIDTRQGSAAVGGSALYSSRSTGGCVRIQAAVNGRRGRWW